MAANKNMNGGKASIAQAIFRTMLTAFLTSIAGSVPCYAAALLLVWISRVPAYILPIGALAEYPGALDSLNGATFYIAWAIAILITSVLLCSFCFYYGPKNPKKKRGYWLRRVYAKSPAVDYRLLIISLIPNMLVFVGVLCVDFIPDIKNGIAIGNAVLNDVVHTYLASVWLFQLVFCVFAFLRFYKAACPSCGAAFCYKYTVIDSTPMLDTVTKTKYDDTGAVVDVSTNKTKYNKVTYNRTCYNCGHSSTETNNENIETV